MCGVGALPFCLNACREGVDMCRIERRAPSGVSPLRFVACRGRPALKCVLLAAALPLDECLAHVRCVFETRIDLRSVQWRVWIEHFAVFQFAPRENILYFATARPSGHRLSQ